MGGGAWFENRRSSWRRPERCVSYLTEVCRADTVASIFKRISEPAPLAKFGAGVTDITQTYKVSRAGHPLLHPLTTRNIMFRGRLLSGGMNECSPSTEITSMQVVL